MRGTGHLHAPEADAERIRARPISAVFGTSLAGTGGEVDLRDLAGGVDDQDQTEACVSYSGCDGLEGVARMAGIPCPRLSRKFGWGGTQLLSQSIAGVPFRERRIRNVGLSVDTFSRLLRDHGLPPESACAFVPKDLVPAADGDLDIQIDVDADLAAADIQITGDHGVDPDDAPETIQIALREKHPAIIAIDISSAMYGLTGPDPEWDGVGAAAVIGGHAVVCYGCRPRIGSSPEAYLCKNSWSRAWGDNGWFWITRRAVREARAVWLFTVAPAVRT